MPLTLFSQCFWDYVSLHSPVNIKLKNSTVKVYSSKGTFYHQVARRLKSLKTYHIPDPLLVAPNPWYIHYQWSGVKLLNGDVNVNTISRLNLWGSCMHFINGCLYHRPISIEYQKVWIKDRILTVFIMPRLTDATWPSSSPLKGRNPIHVL